MGNLIPVEGGNGTLLKQHEKLWGYTDYGPQVRKAFFFGLILP